MANIETEKLSNMVQATGSATISTIATSGPDVQVCIVCVCMRASVCVHTCMHMHACMYIRACVT